MNWKVCSYNERLLTLLAGRKDENLLIFAGSYILTNIKTIPYLTNMEDLKKAKEGQYRN